MSTTREEKLRAYAADAAARLRRAGEALAGRQALSGPSQGNVPPWPGSDDLDLHGSLAAAWIWARADKLNNDDRFALNIAAAWSFAEQHWDRFIPHALGPAASDEAAFDCAMVLRAASAERMLKSDAPSRPRTEGAGRLLGAYLSDLDDLGGREFKDPGFLAWTLAEHAREVNDRGLLATARRFVDRAFGMKAPPPFAEERAPTAGLFDFSSTTATRVLSVIAAEGATPFVGAWLRERVIPVTPAAFVSRPRDENIWNACVAAAIGRSFVVATDPAFFDVHQTLVAELVRRSHHGTIGRQPGLQGETLATFYYALAIDALVKV